MPSGAGEKKKSSTTYPQEGVAQESSHIDCNLRHIVWVIQQTSNCECDIN